MKEKVKGQQKKLRNQWERKKFIKNKAENWYEGQNIDTKN